MCLYGLKLSTIQGHELCCLYKHTNVFYIRILTNWDFQFVFNNVYITFNMHVVRYVETKCRRLWCKQQLCSKSQKAGNGIVYFAFALSSA